MILIEHKFLGDLNSFCKKLYSFFFCAHHNIPILTLQNYVSVYDQRLKSSYHEAAVYVTSKRGTQLVFYDGNTYTPNEKSYPGQGSRNWKCSQYYKSKCKARVITREINNRDVIRSAITEHTHPKIYPQQSNIYPSFSFSQRS